MKKIASILAVLTILFVGQFSLLPKKAKALVIPNFPACVNPQGTKIVDVRGTHGVPGDATTYTGVDKVYLVDGKNQVTQCLCLDDGRGIQTNWWKVSSLDENEIKVLKSEGWIYIPNGSAWGLLDAPYIAQNAGFSCNGGNGGSSGSSSTSAGPIGQVLGLAFTGNILYVYAFLTFGIIATITGLFFSRK